MTLQVVSKLRVDVQGVPQGVHCYPVRDFNGRNDSFKLFHEIAQDLAGEMRQLPKVGSGYALPGEHYVMIEEHAEAIDGEPGKPG